MNVHFTHEQIALELLAVTGQEKPPVDVGACLNFLGIEHVWERELFGPDARVNRDAGSVLVRPGMSETRRRFTLAHEVGHLCLHETIDKVRAREAATEREMGNELGREEREAQSFAAMLLMPRAWFERATIEVGENADDLARMFNVSPRSAELRLQEIRRLRQRDALSPEYRAYLESPEWAIRRDWKLHDVRYQCQLRWPGCTKSTRLHVHHLTYERLGNELPEDLLVACESCHRQWHAVKTAVRTARAS